MPTPPAPSTAPSTAPKLYNALIRTHHITSRRKISLLQHTTTLTSTYALLHVGKNPGIMYVEGRSESAVREWVGVFQRLRYKDGRVVRGVTGMVVEGKSGVGKGRGERGEVGREGDWGRLEEVRSVAEFGERMAQRGVWAWWRVGMGYVSER